MIKGSVAWGPYPDPEGKGGDLEHVSEITGRAVLPASELRSCARCRGRFRGKDIYEVMDWHESSTFYESDRLCRECARNHGVL